MQAHQSSLGQKHRSQVHQFEYDVHRHRISQRRDRHCNFDFAIEVDLALAAAESSKAAIVWYISAGKLVGRELHHPLEIHKKTDERSVCIVSIYRVTIIGNLSLEDAPWADVDPCVWSAVEVCVGIVSACLPTLRPLWTFFISTRSITRNLQGWSRDSDGPRDPGGSNSNNTLSVLKWGRQHTTSSTSDVEHTNKSAI